VLRKVGPWPSNSGLQRTVLVALGDSEVYPCYVVPVAGVAFHLPVASLKPSVRRRIH
jgi:hypothetical protein